MCAITGYISTNGAPTPDTLANFQRILRAGSCRGVDATGFMYPNSEGRVVVSKAAGPPSQVIESLPSTAPRWMVGHNRMKTVGSPLNNLNNHPVVSGRFALVHNGSVQSIASWHQGVKDSLPFHNYAEVDSQLLVETIDILVEERNWKISNAISRGIPRYITGSYACVAVDSADPNTLHLFRGSNPLVLGYDKATDVIWFASTQEIIDAALGTTTRYLEGLFVERHPPKKGSILYSELTSDEYLQITCKNGTIEWEGGSLDRSYTPASISPPVSSHNGATATSPALSSGSS